MAYVKVVKTPAYFRRFQVKYRRRREGKTDYRARLRLVAQDKNKYNTPRYRMVVRFTNRDIVCQVLHSTIAGDMVVGAAYSHELPKYGLKAGLTNWSAAYCTGLLLARRVLTKFGLDKHYEGVTGDDVTGEDFTVEPVEDGPRPFTVVLDTGLKPTTLGSKIFGALKGALDGGLNIPHSEKRFVGYDREKKELDTEVLRDYIFGGHVSNYQEELREEEPEQYRSLFSSYIKAGVKPDEIEDLYTEVHEAIRAKPLASKKARSKPAKTTRWHAVKKTYEQRKEDLKAKLEQLVSA